jgi:hypothetical protein
VVPLFHSVYPASTTYTVGTDYLKRRRTKTNVKPPTWLTKSMEQSKKLLSYSRYCPSLSKLKFLCSILKSAPLVSILRKINPTRTFPKHFFKNQYLSSNLHLQVFWRKWLCICNISHPCCTPRVYHLLWFDHPTHSWCLHIIRLFITQFPPSPLTSCLLRPSVLLSNSLSNILNLGSSQYPKLLLLLLLC